MTSKSPCSKSMSMTCWVLRSRSLNVRDALQTQTCDVAWVNVPFIVVGATPHSVLSISVSIDQHPIISGLGHTRDVTCQTCNVTVQRSSGPHNRSILIRRTPPSRETGFFVPLSKDPDVVLLPTGGSAVNPIPPCVNRHLLKGTAFDPAPHGSTVRSLFFNQPFHVAIGNILIRERRR